MAFKLATAFVDVSTRLGGLQSGLGTAKRMVGGTLRSIASVPGAILGGIGSIFSGITGLVGGLIRTLTSIPALIAGGVGAGIGGLAVKLGSDAEEIGSKFDAVFKETAAGAEEFANEFGTRVGRSVVDTKKQLAEFQDVLVPLGFARKEATELSKALTTAAVDLASFNNKSDEQASQALTKALTGQREMLLSLGITLHESDVKQRLMLKGQKDLEGQALKQAKALATLELIMENSKDAQGDAERTAGSFANRLKGLQGAMKDLGATVGSAVLPMLARMAKTATDAIRGIIPRVKLIAQTFADTSIAIMDNWDLTWEAIKLAFKIGVDFIKENWTVVFQLWSFRLGQMLRETFDFAMKVAEIIKNGIMTGFGFITGETQNLIENMVEQFRRGWEGESFRPKFDFSEDQQTRIDRLREIGNALNEARKQIAADREKSQDEARRAAPGGLPAGAGGAATGIPSGLFGLTQFAQRMQEEFLKEDSQKQMVGLMQADQLAQKEQTNALKSIENMLASNPMIPVATG